MCLYPGGEVEVFLERVPGLRRSFQSYFIGFNLLKTSLYDYNVFTFFVCQKISTCFNQTCIN